LALHSSDVRFGSWLRENADIEFANGNFVSTSINLKNKSAGDGRWDKTIEKTFLRAFRARTFSRSQGQKRKWRHFQNRSAVPPTTDIRRGERHVCFVPIPDLLPKAHDQFARDMRPLNVNRLGPIAIFQSYLKNGLLQLRHTILTANRLEFGWKLESNAMPGDVIGGRNSDGHGANK